MPRKIFRNVRERPLVPHMCAADSLSICWENQYSSTYLPWGVCNNLTPDNSTPEQEPSKLGGRTCISQQTRHSQHLILRTTTWVTRYTSWRTLVVNSHLIIQRCTAFITSTKTLEHTLTLSGQATRQPYKAFQHQWSKQTQKSQT